MSKTTNDSDQPLFPGMDKYVEKEHEEFFWPGQKNERFFDSASLPDIPTRQNNANGANTFMLYMMFPTQADLLLALSIFTMGLRKSLKANDRIGSLNSMALVPNDPKGRTFLQYWAEEFGKVKPIVVDDEEDEDEARAPI